MKFALRPLTVYVRVRPDWLSVRIIETGGSYEDAAVVAVHRERQQFVAACAEAERYEGRGDFEVTRPFGHPRVTIDNPHHAGMLLSYFIRCALGGRRMLLKPRFVLHVLGNIDGGLAAVEKRGFYYMARFAGAGNAALWDGPEELGDARIIEISRLPVV